MKPSASSSNAPLGSRLFYSMASLLLLVVTFLGFRLFYLDGKAFPGHELPPPTKTLLVIHGVAMTLWILLAALQPLLVATKNKRLHLTFGRWGAVLAALVVILGVQTGIAAIRITPAELIRFGLAPKPFLVVPLSSVVLFGIFVAIGVWQRRRLEIHRPMMFLASLSVVSAALGRLPVLNAWCADSILEHALTAFVSTVFLGWLIWGAKALIQRSPDRAMAVGLGVMTLWFYGCSQLARTAAWESLATALLR